jgi:capsular exopolysaccharide synthesis family protein
MFGGLAGLALGLALALLREQLDPGIRGRQQVEKETGLQVLSMVPHVDRPGPVLSIAASEGETDRRRSLARPGRPGGRRLRKAVERAVSLEAFRSLAVEINFATRKSNGDVPDRGFQSLAVTSATRGEGKTLTACNLALVHASAGHRTLLVDTDIRASGVGRFFGFDSGEPGLTDIVGDRRYDFRAVRRDVRIEGGESLAVLLSGPPVRNSTALFEGAAFQNLLEAAESHYDLVIFDTPPLSMITDAAAYMPSGMIRCSRPFISLSSSTGSPMPVAVS